jgi:glycosyltransferase involved in cell wall biosynthesis
MPNRGSISVIIPCYNRATLVGATITNMLNQSLSPLEIIVVDDGSTDNSAEVIAAFGGKVKLISQTNQGPGAARNAGLEAASGDYIQFMDSDDLASNNKLLNQYQALQAGNSDFAYCPWVRCVIKNEAVKFVDNVLQARALPSNKPMIEYFLSGWSLVFQNCLFTRSILEKAGRYRTDLMPSEDSEYFIRILLAGARPIHTPDCLVFYREHDINKITSTGTSIAQRANDWTKYLEITGRLLQEQLDVMSPFTKLTLSANVQSHVAYCQKQGITSLTKDHPYLNLSLPGASLLVPAFNIYQKITRKIKGSSDHHFGFQTQRVDTTHFKMATDIGLKINQELPVQKIF